jgi:hypothetical protein
MNCLSCIFDLNIGSYGGSVEISTYISPFSEFIVEDDWKWLRTGVICPMAFEEGVLDGGELINSSTIIWEPGRSTRCPDSMR